MFLTDPAGRERVTAVIRSINGALVRLAQQYNVPLIDGFDTSDGTGGYVVSGGSIRDVYRGDGNRLVVYVETGVAPGEHKRITLRPLESEL